MRRSKRLAEVVREFNDRGAQWLLESPENLRGFLLTAARSFAHHLDCSRAEQIPTRFIPDNLRKQEADLLFRIPYHEGKGKGRREVFVYILIEHQSTADPTMGFRLLFYMVQIWDKQRREWLDQKVPVSEWRFLPILPIIFYTGEPRWETPLSLTALMDLPRAMRRFVPHFDTLLLNLKASSPEELTASEHPIGWLLRVIRKEHASEAELQKELEEAVEKLSALAKEDLAAWEKAISFLYLLVHHRRGKQEGQRLSQKIEEKVRASRGRKAAQKMEQTLAQYLIEEGRQDGKQEGMIEALQRTLLNLMTEKYGAIPENVAQRVQSLQDTETLDRLLRQVIHAGSLQEMGL